jgi:hypothetical protein
MARTGGSGARDGSAKTTPAPEGGSSGAVAGRSARPAPLRAPSAALRSAQPHGQAAARKVMVLALLHPPSCSTACAVAWLPSWAMRARTTGGHVVAMLTKYARTRTQTIVFARSVTMDTRPWTRS